MTKVITLSELVANIRCRRSGKMYLISFINQCKDSDAVIIPSNATNGDMVLATGMFSVVKELNDGIMVYVKPKGVFGQVLEYNKDWWDAPFKESEEKKNGRNV